jgi:hypothetical protein
MSSYVLALAILVSSVSFAQTSNLVNKSTSKQSTVKKSSLTSTIEASLTKPSDSATTGFRVGYSRPYYSASVDVGLPKGLVMTGDVESPSVNYSNALKFGYAFLPVGSIGYIADLDYIEVNLEEKSNNLGRLSGNAAFAINKLFNVHFGINYANLIGKGASKWDAGYGKQLGVGYQITRNFGFELNYSETNISSSVPIDAIIPGAVASIDLKLRGYDLNFIGTF